MDDLKPSSGWWFWVSQVVPPLFLLVTFGTFNPATTTIVVIPLLVSIYSLVALAIKRQFYRVVRPALTVCIGLLIIGMGNIYVRRSEQYVRDVAVQMQAQCNRDGFCILPLGNWKQSDMEEYKQIYDGRSPGLVPFRVAITFNELAPTISSSSRVEFDSLPTRGVTKYTAFHMARALEDLHYHAFGGVGLPLKFYRADGAGNWRIQSAPTTQKRKSS